MKNKMILIVGCGLMAALFLAGQSWAVIPKIINVQGVLNPPVSNIPITFQINSTPIPTIPGPVTTDKAGYFNTSLDFIKLFPDPYGFPPPDVITILSNGKPVGDVTLTSVPYAFHSELAERGIDGFTVAGRAAIGLGVKKANSSYALQIGDPAFNFPGTNNMAVYGDMKIKTAMGAEGGKQLEKGLIFHGDDPGLIYGESYIPGGVGQPLPIRINHNGANVMIGNASSGNLGIGTLNPLASIQIERDQANIDLKGKNLAYLTLTGDQAYLVLNSKDNPNGSMLVLKNSTTLSSSALGSIRFVDTKTATNVGQIDGTSDGQIIFKIMENPSPKMWINSGGVGVGALYIPSIAQPGGGKAVYVNPVGCLYVGTSSRRYKHDIKDYAGDVAKISKLRPVSFTWNADTPLANTKDTGLIAEEVLKVYPELVGRDKKGQPESVNYEKLPIILLKVVQQQQKDIDALKAEVASLKNNQKK